MSLVPISIDRSKSFVAQVGRVLTGKDQQRKLEWYVADSSNPRDFCGLRNRTRNCPFQQRNCSEFGKYVSSAYRGILASFGAVLVLLSCVVSQSLH